MKEKKRAEKGITENKHEKEVGKDEGRRRYETNTKWKWDDGRKGQLGKRDTP